MPGPKVRKLSDFVLFKKKSSGIESGGVYKLKPELVEAGDNPDTLYFVKQMDVDSTMNEICGANIVRVILGESSPETILLRDGGNVLTASKQIDGFVDFEQFSKGTGIPNTCFPNGCIVENGKFIPIKSYMLDWEAGHNPRVHIFTDAVKMFYTADFVSHGDFHQGNFGIILDSDEKRAALIDFSKSLVGKTVNPVPMNYVTSKSEVSLELEIKHEILSKREQIIEAIGKSAEDMQEAGLRDAVVRRFSRDVEDLVDKRFSSLESEIATLQFINKYKIGHRVEKSRFVDLIKDLNGKVSSMTTIFRYNELMCATALVRKDKAMFTFLLPLMDFQTSANIFIQSITIEESYAFDAMLPIMAENPDGMRYALAEAVRLGKEDRFNAMLPFATDLRDAFDEAVKLGRDNMFSAMLPFMEDELDRMPDTFVESVRLGRENAFRAMLPIILKNRIRESLTGALKEALIESVIQGRDDMFKEMLPFVEKDIFGAKEVLEEAVKQGKDGMFREMLSIMKNNPYSLRDALFRATMLGKDDVIIEMLPFMANEKGKESVRDVLYYAIREEKDDVIGVILPLIVQNQECIDIVKNSNLIDRAKNDGRLFVTLMKTGAAIPDLIAILNDALPAMLRDPALKGQIMYAAEKSGFSDPLGRIHTMEQQPTNSFARVSDAFSFPVAAAASEMRPMPSMPRLEELGDLQSRQASRVAEPMSASGSREMVVPSDTLNSVIQSISGAGPVSTSYPGYSSTGMAVIAVGMLGKAVIGVASKVADFFSAKSDIAEVKNFRKIFRKQYKVCEDDIEEIRDTIKMRRAQIQEQLEPLASLDPYAAPVAPLPNRAALESEDKLLKEVSKKCIDIEDNLEKTRKLFENKSTPTVTKVKLKQIQADLERDNAAITKLQQEAGLTSAGSDIPRDRHH